MAAVDIITYEGPVKSLVWKSPVEDFNYGAQLIVPETKAAIFFRDGMALDLFEGGRHQLSGENLPLLRRIYEKISGNKTVFKCQIYYIDRVVSEELMWGTNSPIQTEDPKYGILVNVKSYGSYKIRISDARKFLIKTVGLIANFTREELQTYFRNEMVSRVKTELAKALVVNNVSILEITASQDKIAETARESLAPLFAEYGVELLRFVISTIKADEGDLARLREIKERKAEMNIYGTNYREMETFGVLHDAARNQSNGIVGMGVGLGVGLGAGPAIGNAFAANVGQEIAPAQAKPAATKRCPDCNTENPVEAKFCNGCGKSFPKEVFCTECGAKNAAGAKFCGECGHKLI